MDVKLTPFCITQILEAKYTDVLTDLAVVAHTVRSDLTSALGTAFVTIGYEAGIVPFSGNTFANNPFISQHQPHHLRRSESGHERGFSRVQRLDIHPGVYDHRQHGGQDYAPDPELQAFLNDVPPPICIRFGGIVLDDPNTMTELIFAAVKSSTNSDWAAVPSIDTDGRENE